MIYGADGSSAITSTLSLIPPPGPKRELIPGPGQVIVLRNEIETTINGIDKPLDLIEKEERSNVMAIIARVGANTDGNGPWREAWFVAGDEVVIAPHVFTEVDLFGELVYLGPFAGVKAKFVMAEPKNE